MSEAREIVAAEGTAPDGEPWTLLYRPEGEGGRHHLALVVNGATRESGSGFDIPEGTEIGFGGGLTPGQGNYYLYGVVASRIQRMRVESAHAAQGPDVMTVELPGATASDGSTLRSFVLVRQPIDDVTALVGLDRDGHVVQRIPF